MSEKTMLHQKIPNRSRLWIPGSRAKARARNDGPTFAGDQQERRLADDRHSGSRASGCPESITTGLPEHSQSSVRVPIVSMCNDDAPAALRENLIEEVGHRDPA